MKRCTFFMITAISTLLLLFQAAGPADAQQQRKQGPGASAGHYREESSAAKKPDALAPGEAIPDWKARWELARLLSYAKRYEESRAQYEKLLKEKPDLTEARVEMAQVLYWSGQKDRAFSILSKLPPDRLDQKARLVLAEVYTANKDYPKAEKIYLEYLDKNPDKLEVRLKLAEILSWEKRYDESLRQYELILKAAPADIQVRRKYAFVLIWAGKQNEAILELQKTLK